MQSRENIWQHLRLIVHKRWRWKICRDYWPRSRWLCETYLWNVPKDTDRYKFRKHLIERVFFCHKIKNTAKWEKQLHIIRITCRVRQSPSVFWQIQFTSEDFNSLAARPSATKSQSHSKRQRWLGDYWEQPRAYYFVWIVGQSLWNREIREYRQADEKKCYNAVFRIRLLRRMWK